MIRNGLLIIRPEEARKENRETENKEIFADGLTSLEDRERRRRSVFRRTVAAGILLLRDGL